METAPLRQYEYNGARSLVLLHEKHMLSCLEAWRESKRMNIILPETDDKNYQSLDTLLLHIFRAARNYMNWMCSKLNLPDPEIEKEPGLNFIETRMDEYAFHLLEKWRFPLAEVPEEKFINQTYTSNWGVEYCIDAMLEHAVMHPIRHEFQLRNLYRNQNNKSNI